jgi:RNase_H superfamily
MTTHKGPRILTLDIESAPLEVYAWQLGEQNVTLDFLKTDWSVLSYAAKWLHSKRMIYADTGNRGADKVRDDSVLMPGLWKLLNSADLVVAQNGKRFDCRKINARLIEHGLGPPSPYRVIDTLISSRKYFAFTSQKLAHTSKLLTDTPKDEHKRYPGFDLWKAVLQDNPEAWTEMETYNKRDVRATEEVYLRLRPWIENHPSVTLHSDPETPSCPNCGSNKMQRRGIAALRGGTYPRFQCQGCGAWSRGKQTMRPAAANKLQLV